jgi:flavin reductase (DIM6/NTAB) family NADH-FMN oxidoreductase RutF
MTANAFTSVSLDPPLILVCVHRDGQLHESIVSAGSFAVSVLSAAQMELAQFFADHDRPPGDDQFDTDDWYPGPLTGAPVSREALAHLECALWRVYDGGDHWIVIGRVLGVNATARDALLFFGGGYHQLTRES